MEAFEANRGEWDQLYRSGYGIHDYPNENLVIIGHHLFGETAGEKLLDLGCGSGANLIHLIKSGFDCTGCDISAAAIEICRARLDALKLSARFSVFEGKLPYPDESFDVVVSWHVLYYNSVESLNFMLGEVFRVLKTKGLFLFTLARPDHVLMKNAERIGDRTYRVNLSDQQGAIIFVPRSRKEVRQICSNFSKVGIGYFKSDYLGNPDSHWVIWGWK